MQQWILIWFSEHCFITVTPTFNIFFRNNLCCVQWPIVIITKCFWYQRRKSNSFHTQKVKWVFWLLFFWQGNLIFWAKTTFKPANRTKTYDFQITEPSKSLICYTHLPEDKQNRTLKLNSNGQKTSWALLYESFVYILISYPWDLSWVSCALLQSWVRFVDVRVSCGKCSSVQSHLPIYVRAWSVSINSCFQI